MACICAKCGETISYPFLYKGSTYGSTCINTVLGSGEKKPRKIKGNWKSAELVKGSLNQFGTTKNPLELTAQFKAVVLCEGTKYRVNGAVTMGNEISSPMMISSRDMTSIMINLDNYKK